MKKEKKAWSGSAMMMLRMDEEMETDVDDNGIRVSVVAWNSKKLASYIGR